MIEPLPSGVDCAGREVRGPDPEPTRQLGLVAFPPTYEGVIEPERIPFLAAKWWTKDALIPSIRAGRTFVAEAKQGRLLGSCAYGPRVVWMAPSEDVQTHEGGPT